MTEILSTRSPNHRDTAAEYRRRAYLTNGWDRMVRWDGRTATAELAGIAGPARTLDSWKPHPTEAAGLCGVGIHLVRYRYMDSRTGYVSDPSEAREVSVSVDMGQLTFLVGAPVAGAVPTNVAFTATTATRAAGDWTTIFAVGDYVKIASAEDAANNGTWGPITALSATVMTIASATWTVNADDDTASFARLALGRIQSSTDAKVDRIVLEMTVVGGAEDEFRKATEALNTATTVVVSIADSDLEVSFLPWDDDGHLPPPLAKVVVSHRDRLWVFGQVVHVAGNADVTNGSVDVDEGASLPDWRESALGTATDPADAPWLFQRDGDAAVYEVAYYDLANTKIVLKSAYQGITGTDVAYKLFSRANEVWVSRAGFPEGFQPLKPLQGPNGEGAGEVVAAIGYGPNMLVFTLSTTFRFAWDVDPTEDVEVFPVSSKHGALSQRVVVEVDGRVFAMNRLGWTVWEGTFPQLISQPIEAIRDLIDYDQAENFHACYFPELRAIRWFVCYEGEIYPKRYVQLDLDTGVWGEGEYLQGISESRLVASATGPRVLLGDENGYSWWGDRGEVDGGVGAHHAVVAAGSTAVTVIVEPLPLPVDSAGTGLLRGTVARWWRGDGTYEDRFVTSNAWDRFSVGVVFTEDPAPGDVIWFGPIPSTLRTRAFTPRRPGKGKLKPGYATIAFLPEAASRLVQVRSYEDLSSTARVPRLATPTKAIQDPQSGVTWPGNNADYPTTDFLGNLSNLDGQWSIPLGTSFRRSVEVEIQCDEPDAEVELTLVDLEHGDLEDPRGRAS